MNLYLHIYVYMYTYMYIYTHTFVTIEVHMWQKDAQFCLQSSVASGHEGGGRPLDDVLQGNTAVVKSIAASLTGRDFSLTPRGHLTMSSDTFDCHSWGVVCPWCLVGRGQGCSQTSYKARAAPRNDRLAPDDNSGKEKKLWCQG